MESAVQSPVIKSGRLRTALKWLLLVWLIAWALIGSAYGLIHVAIVPRIDDWRATLETKLTESLGLPVHIERLSGAASGWTTRFQINGVHIDGLQGSSPLRIDNIDVQFSLASLWQLELENLQVNGANVLLQRDVSGQWSLGGVAIEADKEQTVPAWLDWVLAQPRMVATGATLRVADQMGEPLAWTFSAIDASLINRRRSHDVQIAISPPSALGDRLTLTARMRSGYFSNSLTDFAEWEGRIETTLPGVRFEPLRELLVRLAPPTTRPMQEALALPERWVRGGEGTWRLSMDVGRGLRIQSLSNDIGMTNVDVQLGESLAPIQLKRLAGKLEWSETDLNWTLRTRDLNFETADGLLWPGGNAELSWQGPTNGDQALWALRADQLDIELVNTLASRLPIDSAVRAQLSALMPRGRIEKASLSWSGDLATTTQFTTSGEASGLAWAALPAATSDTDLGRLGGEGVGLSWQATAAGGTAVLRVADGQLTLPGVWVEPTVSVASGEANVRWTAPTATDAAWQVAVEKARLQTPDGRVVGDAVWRSSGSSNGRLRLSATVDQMALTALPRYLPARLPEARAYLARHVLSGTAKGVAVVFDGALDAYPFKSREDGVFDISAQIENATYDYARDLGQGQDWPALAQLNGQFELKDNAVQLTQVSGRLQRAPAIVVRDSRLVWPDLTSDSPLTANMQAAGPMGVWLTEFNRTPLGVKTDGMLTKWRGEGDASVRLAVTVPLADSDKTGVQLSGEANLNNVTLALLDGLPPLQRLQATVQFTDASVDVARAKALWLGGDVEGRGAWRIKADGTTEMRASVKGALRAEDVARTPALGRVALAAQRASGLANFAVDVDQVGVEGVSIRLRAPLKQVRLDLPAPMNKATGADWVLDASLRPAPASDVSKGMTRGQDLLFALGPVDEPIARAHIRREYKSRPAALTAVELAMVEPDLVRGAYAMGSKANDALVMPDSGVAADIRLPAFNVDEWQAVFDQPQRYTPVRIGTALPPLQNQKAATGKTAPAEPSVLDAFQAYLPSTVVGAADALTFEGRVFNRVVMGSARDRNVWRANILADELNGYVQMTVGDTDANSALLVRLAMLRLAESQTKDVVDLLGNQPQAMPSLDVVVDDFSMNGREMGRLELVAKNRQVAANKTPSGNEWLIERLRLDMPEATLKATGQWAPSKLGNGRRTYLDVDLQLRDGGALLTRFGMPGVMRGGEGQLTGEMAWQGAPTRFHTPSLSGALMVNVRKGQFIKADPGLSKLLGVLSLQSLPRRLTLDFSDVFSQGFSFDDLRGTATIRDGIVTTKNLAMQGLGALVLMEGTADMKAETQLIDVVVVPKVDKGTLALLAASANPVIGVLTYFADEFLGNIINQVTVKGFKVTGSWVAPEVTEVKVDERMKQRIPKSKGG